MVEKVPSGEIRKLLDEQYGLKMGKILRAHQGLSNYSVIANTSAGQITVRVHMYDDLTPAKLALEARVIRFLHDAGLPVRAIIKTYDGRDRVKTSFGKPLTVFRFIAGDYLEEVEPSHLEEVGKTLKKLHQALGNFENQGQLIHGDFNPGNFVFTEGRISGIFDLEHVRAGAVTEDLATLLSHYVFLLPNWSPRDIICAVLNGYCGYNQKLVSETIFHTCGILSIENLGDLVGLGLEGLYLEIVKKAEWLASWQSGAPEFYNQRLTELRNSVNL